MLGENNYSSYEVQVNTTFPINRLLADPIVTKHAFEREFRNACSVADELLVAIDDLYVDLRSDLHIETETIRGILAQAAVSIKRNIYCWLFQCQRKNKNSYLVEHAFRTAVYSMSLGFRMGIQEQELVDLGLAAALSDVGKIRIPEAILEKEGALNSAEYAVIRVHPLEGRKILTALSKVSESIIDVVMSHHEQVDGKGYPAGANRSEITLNARIVSIADAFDAMTSERSYAKARTIREAMQILWDRRKEQFDENLVEQFLSILSAFPAGSLVRTNEQPFSVLEPANDSGEWRAISLSDGGSGLNEVLNEFSITQLKVCIDSFEPMLHDVADYDAQRKALLSINI